MVNFCLKNIVFFSVLLTVTTIANAENKLDRPTVDMKCYVEMLGGSYTIYRNFDVPRQKKKHFKRTLLNEHKASQKAKKAQQKRMMYKVKECKEMHQDFNNKAAKALEKEQQDMG